MSWQCGCRACCRGNHERPPRPLSQLPEEGSRETHARQPLPGPNDYLGADQGWHSSAQGSLWNVHAPTLAARTGHIVIVSLQDPLFCLVNTMGQLSVLDHANRWSARSTCDCGRPIAGEMREKTAGYRSLSRGMASAVTLSNSWWTCELAKRCERWFVAITAIPRSTDTACRVPAKPLLIGSIPIGASM